jgi:hypothetical protein
MLTAIIVVFVIGYLAIALEHPIHINKAASALFIGVVCWTLYMLDADRMIPSESVPSWFSAKVGGEHAEHLNREYLLDGQLVHAIAEIAQILEASPNTVASRYQYAMSKLAAKLTKARQEARHA